MIVKGKKGDGVDLLLKILHFHFKIEIKGGCWIRKCHKAILPPVCFPEKMMRSLPKKMDLN
jgi:hypothetical protein